VTVGDPRMARLVPPERLWTLDPAWDALPDAVVVTDADQLIRYVNPAFERLTGWGRDAVVGRDPRLLQGPGTDPRTRAAMRRAIEAREPYVGIVLNYRRDGTPYWNALSIAPVSGSDGAPPRFVSIQRETAPPSGHGPSHARAARELALAARFYRALAETRALLHERSGDPEAAVLSAWCTQVVEVLGLPLVWIGRLPAGSRVVVPVAAAGPAQAYAEGLVLTDDPARLEGRGPAGHALRTLTPTFMPVADPAFAPWRARARTYGLTAVLAAAAPTESGDRIIVGLYWDRTTRLAPGLADVAARLVQDAADWYDRQATTRRLARMAQFREAHRALQAHLMNADSVDAILAAVADTLARSTDALGVTVLVPDPDGGRFQRVRTAGPLGPYLASLPLPALEAGPADASVSVSTRVWAARAPQIIRRPHADPRLPDLWRKPPLSEAGVVAGWPIPRPDQPVPGGVVTITAADPDTFTPELSQLVDEIMRSAGLAWAQVAARRRLRRLQRYQQAALDAQQEFLRLPDRAAIFERVTRLLVERADCPAAYVAAPAPDGSRLVLRALYARDAAVAAALRTLPLSLAPEAGPATLPLAVRAFRTRRPVGPMDPWPEGTRDALPPVLARLRAAIGWPVGRLPDGQPAAVLVLLAESLAELTAELTQLLFQLVTSLDTALAKLDEQARVAALAWRDALTGLGNRRALDERLDGALAAAVQAGHHVAVALLDLDDFKPINDRLGHVAGDEILMTVARLLEANVRPGDFVGRWGGDEFVVVLQGLAEPSAAEPVLRRIEQALAAPVPVPGAPPVAVRASVGIAVFPDDGRRAPDLLRQADQALYHSKLDPGQRPLRWTWAAHLRQHPAPTMILDQVADRIRVVYQPVWDTARRRIVALEALARWRDDTGRLHGPAVFLPRLSPLGRRDLTRAVLATVLDDWLRLAGPGTSADLSLNLNVWPEQVASDAWRRDVVARVRASALPPSRLTWELVETAGDALTPDALARGIDALRAEGFRVALDDIGSGDSSLVRLKQLAVDEIKLDAAFVRDLEHHPEGLVYVATVRELARDLGITLVVEGAETAAIVDALTVLGVPRLQGYAIARPLLPAALVRWCATATPPAASPNLLGLYARVFEDHRPWVAVLRNPRLPAGRLPVAGGDPTDCRTHAYLVELGLQDTAVDRAHRALHHALDVNAGSDRTDARSPDVALTRCLNEVARALREPGRDIPRPEAPGLSTEAPPAPLADDAAG
jgi:diguanylate cyclase (GGDEF)-like protein/PAS domain S-box-containing protein